MVELKRTLSGFKTVQRTLSGFKTTMRRKPKAAAEAPAAAEPAPEQPEKQIKLEQAAPPTPRTGTRFFRALSFSKKGKKESARALTSSDPVAASAPVTAPPTTSERSAPRSPKPDRTAVSDELPPEPAPEVEDELFEMTVPEGVMPGDMLQATTPSGVTVRLEVPEGAEPGTILTFTLPAAEAQPPPPVAPEPPVAPDAPVAPEPPAAPEPPVAAQLPVAAVPLAPAPAPAPVEASAVISEALEAAEATGEADMATHRQVASEVTTEVLAAALGESWEKSAAPPVAMEVLAAALGESPEKSAAPPVAMEVETETVQKSAPARSEMETPASTFVMEEEPEYKAPPSVKVPVKVRKMPMAPPILKARVKESSLCEAMAVCFGGK